MKRLAAALLAGVILVGCGAAFAAGGSTTDPLLSQSYLSGTYLPQTVQQAGVRIDAATAKTYDNAATRLKAQADLHLARAGALAGEGGYAAAFAQQRFKRGDVLTVDAASQVMLLCGSATLGYTSGTVIDVTAGAPVISGTALAPNHRYLAGEDTLCRVTVISDTAVMAPQGYYALTASTETDYNQLAAALKRMGLFRGTDTAYGEGFDLEKTPTRIEGLILFLRLVGEEKAALADTGPCPFLDVPDWCRPYVTYAYAKGYTKGVDLDLKLFGTLNTITAGEYLTFVLRALGYRDDGPAPDFTWDTALVRAQALGCITAGEQALLTGHTFYRAQVAYLSYYALSAPRKSGNTLLSHLTGIGALDATEAYSAMVAVTVRRL